MLYAGSDYFFLPPQAGDMDNGRCEIGKNSFVFALYPNQTNTLRAKYLNGKSFSPYITYDWNGERTTLFDNPSNYTKLIEMNHWKIPKDYPIKF